ncbi:ADP-ribosylglycohydrolase family protein [Dasania marina]|uniref:ADP-ribosylglycohydrolase family protein n=1 Tax=Dasania marina TaxID=471499 RepID=UPI00036B5714|nr:ADP-ribosylglycohydrolase family protein [Dasania marina]
MELIDRVRGCLLAGAIGDALGAGIEFMAIDGIREEYGIEGITDFIPCYGVPVAITDDTQMTLFTAEGLLRYLVLSQLDNKSDIVSVLHQAYLRWLHTQGRGPSINICRDGWLIAEQGLWHQRAPGMTCLDALQTSTYLGQLASNDSKGCGAVMRMAPLGLVPSLEGKFKVACDAARLTHAHASGYLAAGALAMMVEAIVAGNNLQHAIEIAMGRVGQDNDSAELIAAVGKAVALAVTGKAPCPELVETLGAGWIAEEALAISVYCALMAKDMRHGLLLAVNHSGDSDSTGSITGNILGALWGEQAIPCNWLQRLELREVITQVADDLRAVASSITDDLMTRYLG